MDILQLKIDNMVAELNDYPDYFVWTVGEELEPFNSWSEAFDYSKDQFEKGKRDIIIYTFENGQYTQWEDKEGYTTHDYLTMVTRVNKEVTEYQELQDRLKGVTV